jgi:hypothetical protein
LNTNADNREGTKVAKEKREGKRELVFLRVCSSRPSRLRGFFVLVADMPR